MANNNHQHSFWLDFKDDKVRCSRLCGEELNPVKAIENVGPDWTLQITESLLPSYKGKIYLVRFRGEYLCSITDYTLGVLHLLDFTKPEHFEAFKKAVSLCFGVNLIQILNNK